MLFDNCGYEVEGKYSNGEFLSEVEEDAYYEHLYYEVEQFRSMAEAELEGR